MVRVRVRARVRVGFEFRVGGLMLGLRLGLRLVLGFGLGLGLGLTPAHTRHLCVDVPPLWQVASLTVPRAQGQHGSAQDHRRFLRAEQRRRCTGGGAVGPERADRKLCAGRGGRAHSPGVRSLLDLLQVHAGNCSGIHVPCRSSSGGAVRHGRRNVHILQYVPRRYRIPLRQRRSGRLHCSISAVRPATPSGMPPQPMFDLQRL